MIFPNGQNFIAKNIKTLQEYKNFNVILNDFEGNNFDLNIYNVTGQLIYNQANLQPTIGYPISVGNNKGIYFLEIKAENKVISREKLIINN
jgi:hypothetical protein